MVKNNEEFLYGTTNSPTAKVLDQDSGEDEEMGSGRTLGSKKFTKTLQNLGMEIDPMKLDEAADPKVNTLQLWLTAQKIFSGVVRSVDYIPKELA